MATITPVLSSEGGADVWTWSNINTGDTCLPITEPGHSDKTVHITGTITTFALQGSNNEAFGNPATLTDIAAAATPITTTGIFTIKENPLKIRPLLTTGTGVTVVIVCP